MNEMVTNFLVNSLMFLRKIPIIKHIIFYFMRFMGVEIPLKVKIGRNLILPHWSIGTVIHPFTKIGDNVRIYQGVTIGRKNIFDNHDKSFNSIIIQNNVTFCSGAKLLTDQNCIVEEGTIIGANAVLLVQSERIEKGTYVGIPARKL